jgi:hypothetical protein
MKNTQTPVMDLEQGEPLDKGRYLYESKKQRSKGSRNNN